MIPLCLGHGCNCTDVHARVCVCVHFQISTRFVQTAAVPVFTNCVFAFAVAGCPGCVFAAPGAPRNWPHPGTAPYGQACSRLLHPRVWLRRPDQSRGEQNLSQLAHSMVMVTKGMVTKVMVTKGTAPRTQHAHGRHYSILSRCSGFNRIKVQEPAAASALFIISLFFVFCGSSSSGVNIYLFK